MIKNIYCVIFLILSAFYSNAQLDSNRIKGQELDIICYTETVSVGKKFRAILKFRNDSNQVVYVPGKIRVTQDGGFGNIVYELEYLLEGDPDYWLSPTSEDIVRGEKLKLMPYDYYLMDGLIRDLQFSRKGPYRVRYFTNKSIPYDNFQENLRTKWIYFTVK